MKVGNTFQSNQSTCLWLTWTITCLLALPLFYFSTSLVIECFILLSTTLLYIFTSVALPFGIGQYFDALYSRKQYKKVITQYRSSFSYFCILGIFFTIVVIIVASSLEQEDTLRYCLYILSSTFLFQMISGLHRAVEISMHRIKVYKKTVFIENILRLLLTLCIAFITIVILHKDASWISYSYCIGVLGSSLCITIYYLVKNYSLLKVDFFKELFPSKYIHKYIFISAIKYLFPYVFFIVDLCCIKIYVDSESILYLVMLIESVIGYLIIYPYLNTLTEHVENAYGKQDGDKIEKEVNVSFVRMACWIFPLVTFIAFHSSSYSYLIANNVYASSWKENILLFAIFLFTYTLLSISSYLVYAIKKEKSLLVYYFIGIIIKGICLLQTSSYSLSYFLSISILCYAVIAFLNFARLRNVAYTYFPYFIKKSIRILLVCCGMHGSLFLLETYVLPSMEDMFILTNVLKIIVAILMTYCGSSVLYLTKKRGKDSVTHH